MKAISNAASRARVLAGRILPVSVSRSFLGLPGATLLALCALSASLGAQQGGTGDMREVSGAVVMPHESDSTLVQPVPGIWATLHRVGRDGVGPLDSIRTNSMGRYVVQLRVAPDDSAAVFFVSAEYGGVTYFTQPVPPVGIGVQADTIVVFDTTTAPVPLVARGRHIVVGLPDTSDRYLVVEVFELENAGNRTLVAPDEGQFTWSTPLPDGAQDVIAGQGDVSREAFAVRDGRVEVHAPIAPGLKQVSFSYTLDRGDFPLSIPLADSVEVLEVLAEPQRASVSGARLREVERAIMEGRVFRRWLADSASAGSVVSIELPAIDLDRRALYVAGILLALGMLMLLSLARSFQRRVPGRAAADAPVLETPERIAQRIVDLDARFNRRRTPGDSERIAYESERAELKDRLTEALERRDDS